MCEFTFEPFECTSVPDTVVFFSSQSWVSISSLEVHSPHVERESLSWERSVDPKLTQFWVCEKLSL